jgi:hypothetical protein
VHLGPHLGLGPVKVIYSVGGRQLLGDLFAMDNVYFDLRRFPEENVSIPICSKIRSPLNGQPSRVSPLEHDEAQGLEVVTVSFSSEKPPIFTTITKQGNQEETYALHKHGALTDFAKTASNRAVYHGTGFFTAQLGDCNVLLLTLVGTRIFGKTERVYPVPWTGNAAGNLGI